MVHLKLLVLLGVFLTAGPASWGIGTVGTYCLGTVSACQK